MKKTNSKSYSEKQPKRKNKADEKRKPYWSSFSAVIQRLHNTSWLQNGVFCLLAFVPPILGISMGSPKGIIYGVAATLTAFIWALAWLMAREVTTPIEKETQNGNGMTTINGDQIVISAPNNAGTVIGKQTNNLGTFPRQISEPQLSKFVREIAPYKDEAKMEIWVNASDAETVGFANQLVAAIKSSGINPTVTRGMRFDIPSASVEMTVRDPQKWALLINSFGALLSKSNASFKPFHNPNWPESDENKIDIIVRSNSP